MVYIDVIKENGEKAQLFMNDKLEESLRRTKHAVKFHNWDYICVISGLPGVGKSLLAQQIAKYFDENFKSYQICFTAKEFREKTISGEKGQAFILDESFADLNTSLSKDPEFTALINHIQLIRQKNLFIILVLPDFFSLAKNIAVFRSSHLFVPYADEYTHGKFAVFDRGKKRELYIKGKQFINYQAVEPNLRCDFYSDWFCNEEDYLKRKEQHLIEQAKVKEKGVKAGKQRDVICYLLKSMTNLTEKEISDMVRQPESTVGDWYRRGKEWYESKNPPKTDTKFSF